MTGFVSKVEREDRQYQHKEVHENDHAASNRVPGDHDNHDEELTMFGVVKKNDGVEEVLDGQAGMK